MAAKLNAFIANPREPITVNVVTRDIDTDAQWYEYYREYVPVLVVNDEEVCHYFFDADALLSAIKNPDLPMNEDNNQAEN